MESGQEMADAVAAALTAGADWLFMAAAVADFRPAKAVMSKLKKEDLGTGWTLEMVRNPDILGEVVPRHRSKDLTIVGFALETDDLLARASAKCRAKNMNYVVANDPTAMGSGFGLGLHQVTVLSQNETIWASESAPKAALAAELLQRLAQEQSKDNS